MTQTIPELDDLERLEGRTLTGAEFSYLDFRWSRLRDDRIEIEDRVDALLRERARVRAYRRRVAIAVLRWVLVLLCGVAVGLFVSRVAP
jgi:hypothetical protein